MKTYELIYEDRFKNEIKTDEITVINIREARKIRDKVFANSLQNDLNKIRVKLK
jgi:hypothetical protein